MADSTIAQPILVLVVEDEPLLRLHAIDLLEEAGFRTVEAWDADTAIEILAGRDDIRVVFSDIDMPGSMDGLKLASAIRSRWPPIDLLLTSGYFPRSGPDDVPSGCRYLSRPFDDGQLIKMIEGFSLTA